MSSPIIIPEVLQADARDIIWRLNQLGEVYLFPGMPHSVQDGEHLDAEWDHRDAVDYYRHGQDRNQPNQQTPVLTLFGIHVGHYVNITVSPEQQVGEPTVETRVSESVPLYPGDDTRLSIKDGFSTLKGRLESHAEEIEEQAKARLGALATPVGLELMAQLKNTFTDTDTSSEGRTEDITAEVHIVNVTDKPFRVHLQVQRTIEEVIEDAMVTGMLDYGVRWTPWQPHYAREVQGTQSAEWADKDAFYSSMAGLEPSSVGRYGGSRGRSLSDAARLQPQGRPPERTLRFPYQVKYPREIVGKVREIREPI